MVATFEPKTDYKVVGTRPIRHDGYDKVTGRAIYGGDMKLPGLIWGVMVRSPHAHANIKSIDTSAAAAMEGVFAVITGADMPKAPSKLVDLGEGNINFKWASNKLMADDKVLYRGHPVAAIAATDRYVAEEAARKVVVEYEVLESVTNVVDALKPDAPIILPDMVGDDLGEDVTNTNMAAHVRHEFGDVEGAFASASHTIEREYNMQMVHQGYIEPHNATATWDEEDRIKIWTSTQGAFPARTQIAGILQVDVSRVKVTPTEIGGGFGGKIPVYLEPIAALLAKKSQRPVKMVMERTAVFETTGPTPGARMVIKLGADANGKLTVATSDIWFEAGANPGAFIGPAAMCIYAPYEIANTRIDGWDVLVNKPKVAPYRAPGSPQVAFAMESAVDELCEEAGWDSFKFRVDNASKEGTRRGDGVLFSKIGMQEVLEAVKECDHWNAPLGDAPEGKVRGRGIANGYWFNIGLKSSANLAVNTDGTVQLTEGSTDIGGSRTSMAMHVAEVLGIGAHDVRPTVGDTESVGYTDVTGGSRTTYATGYACWLAANNLVDVLKDRVAVLWDIKPDDVDFNDGAFTSKAEAAKSIGFKELAGKLDDLGGPATSTGTVDLESAGDGFGTHIADIEIDLATGKSDIIRYTALQDVGTAIHPAYVEGQLQGGAVQGIGWALNEEYYMQDDGKMANSSFLDYRMPTTLDLPFIDTVLVEVPNPLHPYGVRGVGETPICPPVAAIANAIKDAIGTRLYNTPMNAGSILEALK
ncbi:MAG: xanthine dehydrogenase family protein molybdopterin-binding subunit [Chloroflexi bacterium]|jgi:CO/xanthine dehydrogenase Mo-binding subunit|nr:xanthine dehydrogenase family protein molybdopterin-binding subunit [Chloroflexota bacterium]